MVESTNELQCSQTKNEEVLYVVIWKDLQDILLSEERAKYRMVFCFVFKPHPRIFFREWKGGREQSGSRGGKEGETLM